MGNVKDYLTAVRCSYPVWGESGEIYYLDTRNGAPQIWKKTSAAEQSRQCTANHDKISRMCRNGNRIFFSMDMDGDENEQIYYIEKGCDEVMPFVYHPRNVRNYLGDVHGDEVYYASNKRLRGIFDICRKDIRKGKEEIIIEGTDAVCLPYCVSPDGNRLLYSRRTGFADMQIWMKNLSSGEVTKISKDTGAAMEDNPVWRKNGQGFYYISDRGSEFRRILYWDAATEEQRVVFERNWDVTHAALSPDDCSLAAVVNEDGTSRLYILDTETGNCRKMSGLPGGTIGEEEPLSWSGESGRLLFSFESGSRIQNIWMLDVDTEVFEQVTRCEGMKIKQEELVEPVLCHYESFDGLTVPYWLYVPKGRERKNLPVAIYIHGGPESQIRSYYDETIQYLTGEGIAVAAPNVRGSTGYGKRYMDMDNREKRLDAVKDVEELVTHLVSTGIADEKRLAVFGRSYGGFMTLSCAARLPKLWACAVEVVGMFNLVHFLKHTAGYRRAAREAEYGSLEKDAQMLFDISPEAVIEQMKCPLMIVHGANDTRVPVSEAQNAVRRLRELGREVEYLCFEDEGHMIVKQKNREIYISAAAEFIKKHLS